MLCSFSHPPVSTKANLAEEFQCSARVSNSSGSTQGAIHETKCTSCRLGSLQKRSRVAWGEALSPMVQQVTDRFTAAARVKSSCQGRDAQRLYLRELWVHLASRSNPQVPASSPTSLTSASLSSKSNKTLPCNQHKDKRYLSHCYSMILLRCLALMSREKASPQGAEMRRQNRLFHLLTDVRGDAPD